MSVKTVTTISRITLMPMKTGRRFRLLGGGGSGRAARLVFSALRASPLLPTIDSARSSNPVPGWPGARGFFW